MPTLPEIRLTITLPNKSAYASFLADHVRQEAQQVALLCDDDNADRNAVVARIGYLENQVRMLKALYMPAYEVDHETASRVI